MTWHRDLVNNIDNSSDALLSLVSLAKSLSLSCRLIRFKQKSGSTISSGSMRDRSSQLGRRRLSALCPSVGDVRARSMDVVVSMELTLTGCKSNCACVDYLMLSYLSNPYRDSKGVLPFDVHDEILLLTSPVDRTVTLRKRSVRTAVIIQVTEDAFAFWNQRYILRLSAQTRSVIGVS